MMDVQNLAFHKTPFIFPFKKMFLFIRVLWGCFFTLFGVTRNYFFRFITQKKSSNSKMIQRHDDEQNSESKTDEVENDKGMGEMKEKESEAVFRFHFPAYEEFLQNSNKNGQSLSNSLLCENSYDNFVHVDTKDNFVGSKTDTIAKQKSSLEFSLVEEISKREFSIGNDVFGSENNGIILDEFLHVGNVIKNYDMKKNLNDSTNNEEAMDDGNQFIVDDESLANGTMSNEDAMKDRTHLPSKSESLVNCTMNNVDIIKDSTHLPSNGESFVNGTMNNEDVMKDSTQPPSDDKEDVMEDSIHHPSDDESLVSDSDSDTIAPSSVSSFRSSFIHSLSDGFLSDIDFERAFEVDNSAEFGWSELSLTKEALEKEDIEFQNLSKGYEIDDIDEDEDEDEDILNELKNLESNLEGDNGDSESNIETKVENEQNDVKQSSGEQLSSDSDEQNGLESQWEHQDLVEQLKMEIKKVRSIGLPTILEESETPKIMDDLKPWKIKEKYKLGDTLDELHKFYKSYKERMRKLDILNYQKMYAIGFLRLKDPLKSISKSRISTPALATIVSLDCWPCKPKQSSEINQPVMKKFSKELESDLEMVYVGQMCLSWEFLRWQYGKALELWETDPHEVRRYNEVAGKFQTFQVLLKRFLEDERFQGPRVQNYVKNRCVQRSLLQVPLIRDDNTRDRRTEKKVVNSKKATTSLQLIEIIEDSIRILWRFIKVDKDTSYAGLLKCRKTSNIELQNPADARLLEETQSSLQKKEKKLKELSRGGNCILRKIQKHHQEEDSDHVLYFFSQVDLRLVSRVLNMPRITTEQLIWCSDKLNNIRLVDRKLHVDPSIVLLFPCS